MQYIDIHMVISMIPLLITVLQFFTKLVSYRHPKNMHIQQVGLFLKFTKIAATIIAFIYNYGYWPLF